LYLPFDDTPLPPARRDYTQYAALYNTVRQAACDYRTYYLNDKGHTQSSFNKVIDFESWCFVREDRRCADGRIDYRVNNAAVKFNFLLDYGERMCLEGADAAGQLHVVDLYRKNAQVGVAPPNGACLRLLFSMNLMACGHLAEACGFIFADESWLQHAHNIPPCFIFHMGCGASRACGRLAEGWGFIFRGKSY
jgi:hypothetical protein